MRMFGFTCQSFEAMLYQRLNVLWYLLNLFLHYLRGKEFFSVKKTDEMDAGSFLCDVVNMKHNVNIALN